MGPKVLALNYEIMSRGLKNLSKSVENADTRTLSVKCDYYRIFALATCKAGILTPF